MVFVHSALSLQIMQAWSAIGFPNKKLWGFLVLDFFRNRVHNQNQQGQCTDWVRLNQVNLGIKHLTLF